MRYKEERHDNRCFYPLFMLMSCNFFYDNFVYLLKQEHKIFTVNIYENEKINDNAIYTATLLLNMLPACDGLDDHYSTNPTYRLSFSTDTLAFDTIFQYDRFYHPSIYDLQ